MAKKIDVVTGVIAATMLTFGIMSGCAENNDTEAGVDESVVQEQQSQKDFDGFNCVDTGSGMFYIETPDGTSENGNVPKLLVEEDTWMMQIGCGSEDMDYAKCMVYIDGMENCELVTSDMMQSVLNLEGDAFAPGIHTVEVVAMDGDTVTIYKSAQYEVV